MNILSKNFAKSKCTDWKHFTEKGRIEEAIYTYVHHSGPTTFARLESALHPFIPVDGERSLTLKDPNVFLWMHTSDPLADALKSLVNPGRLYLHAAPLAAYLRDGKVLDLPLVEQLPLHKLYDSPHWLPALLAAYPMFSPQEGDFGSGGQGGEQ